MADQEQHSVKADTDYTVLVSFGGPWDSAGTTSARDAATAIKNVAAKTLTDEKPSGTFVAVPSRSFNPTPVSVKVERSLVIGGAS